MNELTILNELEDVCGQIANAKELLESLENIEHDLREELEIAAL